MSKEVVTTEIILDNTKDEVVVIVDENDNVTGGSPRKDMVSFFH